MKRISLVPKPKGKRKELQEALDRKEYDLRELQCAGKNFETFFTLYTKQRTIPKKTQLQEDFSTNNKNIQQDEEEEIQGPLENENFNFSTAAFEDIIASYSSTTNREVTLQVEEIEHVVNGVNEILNNFCAKKKAKAQNLVDNPLVHIFYHLYDTRNGSILLLSVSCALFNILNIIFGLFYVFVLLGVWPVLTSILMPIWQFWVVFFGFLVVYNAIGFGTLAFSTMLYNKLKTKYLLKIENFDDKMEDSICKFIQKVNLERKQAGLLEMFVYEPNFEIKLTSNDQLRVYKTPKLHFVVKTINKTEEISSKKHKSITLLSPPPPTFIQNSRSNSKANSPKMQEQQKEIFADDLQKTLGLNNNAQNTPKNDNTNLNLQTNGNEIQQQKDSTEFLFHEDFSPRNEGIEEENVEQLDG